MKLLFSYTGPLIKDNKGNYYSRTITDKMLSRYFKIADEINIFTRVKKVLDEKELERLTRIDSKNFSVTELPDISSLKGFFYNSGKVKKQIKDAIVRSDIIIARLPCVTGNIVVQTAIENQKPYLVEVVGCPRDVYWNHSYKGKLAALPSYLAMKRTVRRAPYALYVTTKFLQHRYSCKGRVIGCSDVSLPKLNEDILKKRLFRINNPEDRPIVIGTTAAVNVKYKGQEYVIKAMSRLISEGYNFEYHLAGGGEETYLKSIAEKHGVLDKVKFLGSLPHERVFEYLDNIDLYIQPSKTEGLPRALVEAMSRGCPSLGSNVGGIPELVNRDFIFNAGSIDEIYTLLKMMDMKTMSDEARRSFKKAKEFDSTLLEEQRITFYREFAEICKQ